MHLAIIGCGQLARMMALAGWRLGATFSFLAEPDENTSGVDRLGTVVKRTPELTGQALFDALGQPSSVTVEREHVDVELLKTLQPFCLVAPNPDAILVSQHRGREKDFMAAHGIATAPYKVATGRANLKDAVLHIGLPVIIKTCEQGYDGKGQWLIRDSQALEETLSDIPDHVECVVEGFVNFSKEVSIISARSSSGECAYYPLTENEHRQGILVSSIAPADVPSESTLQQADKIANTILEKLDYVGILSIEFFVVGDQLVVNEIAPRVHNSGHWTQSAGIASQFENHIRAISGLPLGETKPKTQAAMLNLLGKEVDETLLNRGNLEIHLYNKSLRPGRKVGHVNLWHIDRAPLVKQLKELHQQVYGDD